MILIIIAVRVPQEKKSAGNIFQDVILTPAFAGPDGAMMKIRCIINHSNAVQLLMIARPI